MKHNSQNNIILKRIKEEEEEEEEWVFEGWKKNTIPN
jgi:hypothetical protein